MHCPLFSVDAKIEAQLCGRFTVTGGHQLRPVCLAYQPPANSTFLNKPATTNQSAVLFSQNKPAPATSHQPNEQVLSSDLLQNNLLMDSRC
jgi:hypothetical protein